MIRNSRVYDALKYIQRIVLPAAAALYAALAGIWGFPCAEAVVGTITAADAFMGALLQLEYNAWNGGEDR